MRKTRNRTKQTSSLQYRLSRMGKRRSSKGRGTAAGPERDDLLKKVRHADAATRFDNWYNSPNNQEPT
jgi:hypothetical protein